MKIVWVSGVGFNDLKPFDKYVYLNQSISFGETKVTIKVFKKVALSQV